MKPTDITLPGISLARITPVPAQPQFISRLGLLDWLEEPAPRAVVIMAPAGYGKTTIASQWAARHPGKVAWYTASKQDTSRDAIFSFVASIRQVHAGFAPWVDELAGTDFDRRAVAIQICNEIGTWDEDLLFVFDDLDNLPQEHTEIFQAWVDNAPMNTKTLSTRSTMPTISYSRGINLNVIRFLTSTELTFSQTEIDVLLTQHGLDPANPEIRKAIEIADGWPAGVQMVITALLNEDGNFAKEFTSQRLTADLRHQNIIRSALAFLSNEEVGLLKRLALYEVFDLELISSLGVADNLEVLLNQLSRENLFLARVGDNPNQYSVNEIIGSYLIEELKAEQDLYLAVVRQAADYYLSQGDFLHALLLLDRIDDSERVLAIASGNLLDIMFTANRELFYRCVESLERHMQVDQASSLYFRAAFETVVGNRDAATVLTSKLRNELLTKNPHEIGEAELVLLESRLALLDGRFNDVIALGTSLLALDATDRSSSIAHAVTIFRAATTAAFLMENYETMLLMHNAAVETPGALPELVSAISLPAIGALLALAEGRLRDVVELSLLALDNADKRQISGMFFPFEAVYCLADAYREYGDLKRAEDVIARYLPLAQEHQQTHWIVALNAKLALIAAARGEIAQSLGYIRTARDLVAGSKFGQDISRVIDEHELLIRVALIDNERIAELLYRMPQTRTTLAFILSYQAQREPSKAESLLATFPANNPREKLLKELISAQIFGEQPHRARAHLENAVEIAVKNGFKAIFTLQAAKTQNYLLELASKQPTVYMEQLATAIRERMSKGEASSHSAGVGLTKQELNILRRLGTGLPIAQIAASLHISQNTIKTHLKNLYRKMDVDSREEAVTRGRELSLL